MEKVGERIKERERGREKEKERERERERQTDRQRQRSFSPEILKSILCVCVFNPFCPFNSLTVVSLYL